VGIDVHKKDWVVISIMRGEEIYRGVEIPEPEALISADKRAMKPSSSYGLGSRRKQDIGCTIALQGQD